MELIQMKINTSRFGEVEVDENLIFNFIEPILGYEHLSKFILLDHTPDSPFKWLQSAEDPDVAFPVTFPAFFGIDYQFVISEEKAKKLELTNAENLLSFNIACVPQGNPENSSVNLIGPIVVNMDNKNSMQLVLTNSNFSTKHRLFNQPSSKIEKTEV
jgi:flagellar assembly factor FliW